MASQQQQRHEIVDLVEKMTSCNMDLMSISGQLNDDSEQRAVQMVLQLLENQEQHDAVFSKAISNSKQTSRARRNPSIEGGVQAELYAEIYKGSSALASVSVAPNVCSDYCCTKNIRNSHRTSLLHHAAAPPPLLHPTNHQHHQHHHQQQQQQHALSHPTQYALHQQQLPPSPPMSELKMDIYAAYAYQQQLQQQLTQQRQTLNGDHRVPNHHQLQQQHQQQQQQQHHQSAFGVAPELVLDLSRRCDSAENSPSRKTPSPTHTHSSCGTASPIASPTSHRQAAQHQQQQQLRLQQHPIPANLIFSTQALPAAAPFSALYPALYYPGAAAQVKQELVSPPPAEVTQTQFSAAKSLLQSFASAAAVAASASVCSASSSSSSAASNADDDDEEINVLRCTPQITIQPPSANIAAAAAHDVTKTTATRPFKSFPRDPLVIAAKFEANDGLHEIPRGVERYTEYRKRVLEQIRNSNGGSRTVTNPKMRRTNTGSAFSSSSSSSSSPTSNGHSECEERAAAAAAAAEDSSSDSESIAGNFEKQSSPGDSADAHSNQKDAAYYERRRKNNAAAKKSRDRRRIKEDEIAIRAAYLERQNIELLCQIDSLKTQLAAYNSKMCK